MTARYRVLALVLLVSLAVAGCGPAATPAPILPTSTRLSPTGTAIQPTPTLVPVSPTDTQVPPTETPFPPTSTPPPPTGSSGGLIAFVSTRDGNGEIYVMNADGSNARRLTNHSLWDGFPDWSPDGTQIAYYSYLSSKNWVIKVMDADGSNPRQVTDSGVCDGAPHWSPDGTQITYDSGDCSGDQREIYVIGVNGGTPVNLSNNAADDMLAAWSPDGTRLVFSSNRDGNYEIYTMAADGSNVDRLTDNPAEDHAPAWSPDGTRIAFYSDRDGNAEIYVMDADGGNPSNMTNHPANDWFPRWSPDGRQMTFSSWRDGNLEIYAMNADGSDVRRLTNSPGDDFNSVWQPAPVGRSSGTWSRSYQDEILGTVVDGTPAGDGGYLFVGSTHYTHYNRDDEDLYLLKTDAAGEPLWEKTLGGDRFDRGIDILPAAGGGFLVLGETRSLGAGDRDIYLLMVDGQGEQLWSRTFGGPKEEQASAIQPTADGGYTLSGQTASFGAGGTDLYLVKTDAQGNEEWARTFGSELDEEGSDAAELPEGGFLVLGVLLHKGQDYLAMNPDLYLVRTDGQGTVRWSKVLEEPGVQAGFHMQPTPDGHYLITGLRSDTGTDVGIDPLLMQIDADGNILWDQAIGEPNSMDYASAILATADGGYLLTGLSVRDGRGGIPLTKLDGNGQVLWREMLAEERGNRAGIAILEAVGGGYLIIGTVSDRGQGWYTLLMKTDEGRESSPAPPVPLLQKSPQEFDSRGTFQAGLGDLDGDGDLDAVFANPQQHDSEVWLNDGRGNFVDTGQQLTQYGHGVGVADFDGDGDLDAFIACHQFITPSKIYLNDGTGLMQDTAQDLGDRSSSATEVNLLDLNGDGHIDVHVMYYDPKGLPDKVYLNDGTGAFADSGLALDEEPIAWGDLDGDGDVDYFGKRRGQGYVVQLNDGSGQFTEGWQMDDSQVTVGAVALADLDGDSDLDALVTNGFRDTDSFPSRLLWNDGSGQFSDSGQRLNETLAAEVAVGDLDGDGDLDLFVSNMDLPNEVWLNNGGQLVDSGLRLGENSDMSSKPSLGDLDGDGDLDLFIGSLTGRPEIWFNTTAAGPSTESDPVVTDLAAGCPPASWAGKVDPAISIYSVTFVVNGREQVVRGGGMLQALVGDEVQVREVTICAGSFSGDGGEACVDFVPVSQGGQELGPEHAGTHLVRVTPGFTTISGPDRVWTVDESWNDIAAVLNHWPPGNTDDLDCADRRCERDDRITVGLPNRVPITPATAARVENVHTLRGHDGSVMSLVFSADGTLPAATDSAGLVEVWEVGPGRELFSLPGHSSPIGALTFSADDSRLASGSFDRTVKLWGVEK